MCYSTSIDKEVKDLEIHFKRKLKQERLFVKMDTNLGFIHNFTPILSNDESQFITMAQWGLLPTWAKDRSFQANTLNARIETLTEKPTFKPYLNNRCLIIADGFYEWQWLDSKGKNKQKYCITIPNKEIFTFAGLYADRFDTATNETYRTYTIVTNEANELMAQIHNTKKRMPIILPPEYESHWLGNGKLDDFINIETELIATKC